MGLICVPDKYTKHNEKPLVKRGDKAYGVLLTYWRETDNGKVRTNGKTLAIAYYLMEFNCMVDSDYNSAWGDLRPTGYVLVVKMPWDFSTWWLLEGDGDIAVTRLSESKLRVDSRKRKKPDIISWDIFGPYKVDGSKIMVGEEVHLDD